jgi:hypothetical protein
MGQYEGNIEKPILSKLVLNRLFGLRFSVSDLIRQKKVNWNRLIVSSEKWQNNTDERDGHVFIYAESKSVNKDGGLASKCRGRGKSLFKLGVNGVLFGKKSVEQRLSRLDPIDADDQTNQFELYNLAEKDDEDKFTGKFKRLPHDLVVKFRGDLFEFLYTKRKIICENDHLIAQRIKEHQERCRNDDDLPLFASIRKQAQALEVQIKKESESIDCRYNIEFEVIITIPSCEFIDPYWQIIPKIQDQDISFLQSFSGQREDDLKRIDFIYQMLFSRDANQDLRLRKNQIRVLILKKMFESHLKLPKGRTLSDWLNSYDQL